MFNPSGELCSIAYLMESFHDDAEHIFVRVRVCREAEIGEGCVGDRGGV